MSTYKKTAIIGYDSENNVVNASCITIGLESTDGIDILIDAIEVFFSAGGCTTVGVTFEKQRTIFLGKESLPKLTTFITRCINTPSLHDIRKASENIKRSYFWMKYKDEPKSETRTE